MNKTLFLQSEVADPYALYRQRLAEKAIHRDGDGDCWAVYSYDACRELLMHPSMLIPPSSPEGLNEYTTAIRQGLVRLQNPPGHTATRAATAQHYANISEPDWPALLEELLTQQNIDWVEKVAGRLPATGVLAGLGFSHVQRQPVLEQLPVLVKIMQPAPSKEDAVLIDHAATVIGHCLEQRLPASAIAAVCGLLIQSYDAGKGILCNALFHAGKQGPSADWPAFVTEVLRFDSPVHHTRRVAGEDLAGEDLPLIRKGDKVLLFLASANRDETHFHQAAQFDMHRPNNHEYLSLGAGAHACMAREFITKMVSDVMGYLFKRYAHIRVQEAPLVYEPLFNVRVPRGLVVQLIE